MSRSSDRPVAVSLAAAWAAIEGLRALVGAVFLALASITLPFAIVGLVFALFELFAALGLFAVSVGLFRVRGWARLGGMVLFGLMALLNVAALLHQGSLDGVVSLALNGAALAVLASNKDVFGRGRYGI